MKHTVFYAITALAMLVPAAVQAQRVQSIPDEVNEIRIEGHQNLHIVSGDENRIETNSDKSGIARVRNGRMTFSSDADDIIIRLAPSRSMVFRAEDYATMVFNGSFAIRDNLTVETEDYAQATFAGDTTDTVRAANIVLRADDFSRITSDVILKHYNYELASSDFSRIVLAGMDLMESSEANNWGELHLSTHINDKGKVYRGRMTAGGIVLKTDYPEDDDLTSRVEIDATDRAVDFARDLSTEIKRNSKKSNRHPWRTNLDFAWGWHNWGDQIGNGFSGIEGTAEAVTNFRNLQLAINVPVVNTNHFAIMAGVGVQWDKFRLATPEVTFDQSTTPYSFAAGTWGESVATSYIKARSVMLPIKFEFGDRNHWHFSITAMPGFAWTGKNTGLRRHYNEVEATFDEHTDKDYSINSHFNPYRLDVRAAVQYAGLGVYVQAATLPLFKDDSQKLYPIMFGIIL